MFRGVLFWTVAMKREVMVGLKFALRAARPKELNGMLRVNIFEEAGNREMFVLDQ